MFNQSFAGKYRMPSNHLDVAMYRSHDNVTPGRNHNLSVTLPTQLCGYIWHNAFKQVIACKSALHVIAGVLFPTSGLTIYPPVTQLGPGMPYKILTKQRCSDCFYYAPYDCAPTIAILCAYHCDIVRFVAEHCGNFLSHRYSNSEDYHVSSILVDCNDSFGVLQTKRFLESPAVPFAVHYSCF